MLIDLRPIHLQTFYQKRLSDGIKASTVLHYHANIHKALKHVVKMELISCNPSDQLELPKKTPLWVAFTLNWRCSSYWTAFTGTSASCAFS